jgi:hypothetical protein
MPHQLRFLKTLPAFLLLLVSVACHAQSPTGLTITRVVPDKLLYDTGNAVNVAVTVSNPTETPQKGELRTRLEWEMDEGVPLGSQPVELKPKEEQTFTFTWKKSTQVLGAGAYAELVQDGKVVSEAHDFFNIVDPADALRVSLQGAFDGQIPASALDRSNYLNVYESVGWGGGTINWMNPQGDAWPGAWGWVTRENIKKLTNNPWGIKIIAYILSYTQQVSGERFCVREPDRMLFNATGAISTISGFDMNGDAVSHRVPREPGRIEASSYNAFPDWTQERNVYYWADEILKSAKEFGWKGIRFDGTPEFIAMDSFESYNAEGRRFTLAEKQALSKEANAKFRKYIRSKAPDFLLYYNCEPALDKVTPYACLPEYAADGSTVGSEVTRDAVSTSNPYNRWDELYERFALNVELVRQNGGFYSAIIAGPHMHMGKESTQLSYATMFATGTQPWMTLVPIPGHPLHKDGIGKIPVPYYKTMTRYSSLFWGHGLTRVADPEKSISVTAPEGREIWWKRTPSMRTTLGGKKLLILTFLNKPPTDINLGTKQTLPEPIKDFTVSFKPLDGKLPVKVWNIQPWPDTVTTELPIRKEGEQVVVTVPRLDYASVLVAELQ